MAIEIVYAFPDGPKPSEAELATIYHRRNAGSLPHFDFTRRGPTPSVGFLGPMLSTHGGTETWHATLLPRLKVLGLDVAGYAVLSGEMAGAPAKAMQSAGIPLGTGEVAMRALAAVSDVAVAWGLADPGEYLTGRQKLVVVTHGDIRNPWTTERIHQAARRADAVVAVAGAALETIPAECRHDKAVVLSNAIDPDRLVPSGSRGEIRAKLGWAGKVLLHLGRLSAEKRPELALEALAFLPGWILAFAGAGAEEPSLRALADRLGVPHRVRWLGRRDDVGDLLHAADVCVCPSFTEGFGLSAAEAMWAGCAVVACPVGFLTDGDAPASLVNLDASPTEWAIAIQEAAWHANQATEAQEWARERFHPDQWAAKWTDLIRSLAPVIEPVPAVVIPPPPPPQRAGGPGTELTKMLAWFHATPSSGCACKALAAEMDALGVDGCRREIDRLSEAVAASGSQLTGLPVPVWSAKLAIGLACDRATGNDANT